MSDTLVIPSMALIPDELKLDLGSIPTGMIPLLGKPIFEHIADSYDEDSACTDVRRVIGCGEKASRIEQWAERSTYEWTLIEIEDSSSVGDTVDQTLQTLRNRGWLDSGNLFVQFADTLVYPAYTGCHDDQITFDVVDHPVRWTTFESTADGRIHSISEKFSTVPSKPKNTFVGQFQFSNPEQFASALDRSVSRDGLVDPLDPFYAALLEYVEDRAYSLWRPEDWIDVGHLDTYYRAKTRFLNTRGFNKVRVNENRNVLWKQSTEKDILLPEIRWYSELPAELKPFTPQIFDYATDDNSFIKLEYIGYPPLSDIYLYGDHGVHIWKNIFTSIFDTVDEFRRHESDDAEEMAVAREEMYLEKTKSRLSRLRADPAFEFVFDDGLIDINGTTYDSVGWILKRLQSDLERTGLLAAVVPTVIHGDLCFPNILFDVRTSLVKLIDPRGEFGSFDIYGDFRYDLAKLLHSVDGNYDFIINDRFDVEIDESARSIEYSVYTTEEHDQHRDLFLSMLQSRYPSEYTQLWGIESLLWLSMVPLHSDEPSRQRVMLAQGIEKYHAAFGSNT